jgi:hypothetical protein
MENITLYTRVGEEVVTVLMPRFTPRAEVVLWGARVFVWHKDVQQYREGMAWVAPLSTEVKDDRRRT